MEFDFAAEEALAVTEEPVVAPKVIRFPRAVAASASYPPGHWTREPEIPQPEEAPARIVEALGKDAAEQGVTGEFAQAAPSRPAEQMELLPNFEDIRLEPGHTRPQTETEVVPRPASLQRRFLAGLLDVMVVLVAAAIFGFTFVRLAEDEPHSRMALLCGLAVGGVLWILFQYLFLVHGKGTPGMRLAQLELAGFEGEPVSTSARRCRALASALSALSIGLGYAWALVDEDQLGWHDRITGTLVCSRRQPSAAGNELWD